MNSALLLLEIQNDYFPNGRIPLERSVEAANKTQAALHIYRERQLPIIHVQHISTQPNAAYFLPCTRGADFHHSVQPLKGEMIIKKHYPNSFKDTGLLNYLTKQKINNLIICGMMSHLAVDATVRAAFDFGFNCTIIHDACTAKTLEFNHGAIPAQNVHYSFMAALENHYANILGLDEFLAQMGAKIAVAS